MHSALFSLGFSYGIIIDTLLLQYWRLVTPALLHNNLIHLLVNSYALHVLGILLALDVLL